MRIQLLDPPHSKRRMVDVVLDAVSLVHAGLASRGALSSLTELELALVYDWAERERRSSVDSHVERRPRPSCLDSAVVVSSFAEIAASSDSDAVTMARFRERLAELSRTRNAPSRTRNAPPVFSMAASSPLPLPTPIPVAVSDRPADVVPASTGTPRGRVGHRVSIDFVLRLPLGVEPPTPTREAVEAAALAMAGPDHEIDPDVRVFCVEAHELWEALGPVARMFGEPARSRIHRTLVRGGVTSPGDLLQVGPSALRQLPGLGEGSIRALSRAGLLGGRSTRRRSSRIRASARRRSTS